MEKSFLPQLEAHKQYKALAPKTHEYLDRLAEMLADNVVQLHTGMHYGEQSKQVNLTITDKMAKDWPYLELIQIGDVQFGHKDCKVEKVIEFRDYVLSKPWRFILFTGDEIDAAHAFTSGSTWDNLFDQQSQVYRFCEVFGPARHRIWGYVGGNHERRGLPVFGDLGILLATMLRIPYSNGRQYINITFGKHSPFRVLLWHGHPRARTKGALAQIMDRYMKIGNAQLYLTGHNHQGLCIPEYREISDGYGIKLEKVIGASSTSFLETYGSYGEWMGFGAYDVIMPRAQIRRGGGNDWALVVE